LLSLCEFADTIIAPRQRLQACTVAGNRRGQEFFPFAEARNRAMKLSVCKKHKAAFAPAARENAILGSAF
jgi:hypothetical protein